MRRNDGEYELKRANLTTHSRIRTAADVDAGAKSRPRGLRAGPVGRQARILALQALFAADVRGAVAAGVADNAAAAADDDALLDWLCADAPARPAVRRNAANIAAAVSDAVAELDTAVQRFAPAIPVNLLAIVDRNILRMAIYELTNRESVPRQVMLKEAVELASMFGSASSARFVNGVLGAFLNDRDQNDRDTMDGAAATPSSAVDPVPHPENHSPTQSIPSAT